MNSTKKYNYPVKIPTWVNFRNLIFLNADPIRIINKTCKEYGDTYYVKLPARSDEFIFTQNADLIQYVLKKNHRNYEKSDLQTEVLAKYVGKGLLTNYGEDWLKQRRLIQPGFKRENIEALFQIIENEIDEFLRNLPKNKTVNVLDLMNKLAFKIVARSMFSSSLSEEKLNLVSMAVTVSQETFANEMNRPYGRWFMKYNGEIKRAMNLVEQGRGVFQEIIDARRKSTEPKHDLLDMLLSARYEGTDEGMSNQQIMDEMLILFIAGHETTANALTWAIYLLSQHPTEVEKLRLETKECSQVDWNFLMQPRHSKHIVQESLRLFPPVWALDRTSLKEDGFNGYRWKKGTRIYMYLYGLQRNEQFWSKPERFNPDRFFTEDVKKKPYYPFGAGPRLCIGNHFAILEMQMALRKIFQVFDFEISTETKVKHKALVTLRPEGVIGRFLRI